MTAVRTCSKLPHFLFTQSMNSGLPPIPARRYFTIGEVAELCGVKTHVLRYWEQEFTQLRPVKRRGNRRYYQHHEVLMIRRIRDLLYEQGFTISGARNKLQELAQGGRVDNASPILEQPHGADVGLLDPDATLTTLVEGQPPVTELRQYLQEIRTLLTI